MSKKKTATKSSIKNQNPYVSNMKTSYVETVVPNMVSRFSYDNPMEVPRLLSISLNIYVFYHVIVTTIKCIFRKQFF